MFANYLFTNLLQIYDLTLSPAILLNWSGKEAHSIQKEGNRIIRLSEASCSFERSFLFKPMFDIVVSLFDDALPAPNIT